MKKLDLLTGHTLLGFQSMSEASNWVKYHKISFAVFDMGLYSITEIAQCSNEEDWPVLRDPINLKYLNYQTRRHDILTAPVSFWNACHYLALQGCRWFTTIKDETIEHLLEVDKLKDQAILQSFSK